MLLSYFLGYILSGIYNIIGKTRNKMDATPSVNRNTKHIETPTIFNSNRAIYTVDLSRYRDTYDVVPFKERDVHTEKAKILVLKVNSKVIYYHYAPGRYDMRSVTDEERSYSVSATTSHGAYRFPYDEAAMLHVVPLLNSRHYHLHPFTINGDESTNIIQKYIPIKKEGMSIYGMDQNNPWLNMVGWPTYYRRLRMHGRQGTFLKRWGEPLNPVIQTRAMSRVKERYNAGKNIYSEYVFPVHDSVLERDLMVLHLAHMRVTNATLSVILDCFTEQQLSAIEIVVVSNTDCIVDEYFYGECMARLPNLKALYTDYVVHKYKSPLALVAQYCPNLVLLSAIGPLTYHKCIDINGTDLGKTHYRGTSNPFKLVTSWDMKTRDIDAPVPKNLMYVMLSEAYTVPCTELTDDECTATYEDSRAPPVYSSHAVVPVTRSIITPKLEIIDSRREKEYEQLISDNMVMREYAMSLINAI